MLLYAYGGMPWYAALLMDAGAVTRDQMLDFLTSQGSPFLNEGKDLLVSKFGRNYSIYFAVLQLIAAGKFRFIYPHQGLIETGRYEIALIALNDLSKTAFLAEIERNAKKINPQALIMESAAIQKNLRPYQISFHSLSMEDM